MNEAPSILAKFICDELQTLAKVDLVQYPYVSPPHLLGLPLVLWPHTYLLMLKHGFMKLEEPDSRHFDCAYLAT